jgi:hypothetical protein
MIVPQRLKWVEYRVRRDVRSVGLENLDGPTDPQKTRVGNDEDYDVLADGAVVGRILRCTRPRWERLGCGRWPSDSMKIRASPTQIR